ncbi:MAG TPA: crosslink repair DNA glycosylase YcaQ family protein [Acidimicrobiales bacterium]|nr:crosslink repair DNA glycosylase YcaQ family protein [Acidimicrobiales bacterium]
MERLTAGQARRAALAAQGFYDRRPGGRVDARHVRRVVDRVGLFQLDSVNVLVRAHYLPLFSRLGPYDQGLLDRAAWGRGASLFEAWSHERSLLPVEAHPLVRWRMAAAADGNVWGGALRVSREKAAFVETVYGEVADRGPLAAGELADGGEARRGPWWSWSDGKRALEWLSWTGRLAVRRRPSFELEYDLPERVLPAAVLAAPTPPEQEARAALLLIAAGALGVATVEDLADYHRQSVPEVRPVVAGLVAEGRLVPVAVEGWHRPAFALPGLRVPRRPPATPALVSPFDSLVWFRPRVERLFGFHYRLEIFVPAARRRWGYYVLPFLLGDRLVARVDLKADRRAGALLVRAAWVEDGAPPAEVAGALAGELDVMAGWLALDRVVVEDRGDLAPLLLPGK